MRRSSKWLSNLLLDSRASFCSCNSATKPIGVPKISNKLTYKKLNQPQSKLSSRNAKDVNQVRESDKTKNSMLPKVKAENPPDKVSPGVQLSAKHNFKPNRIKKLPYDSRKNTQELLAKIMNSQRVNVLATKTFPTGSLKLPESSPKGSLKNKGTERGLKSNNGLVKEANNNHFKLNAKKEEKNSAKIAVGIKNMLKYDKKFVEHVRVNADKPKVDDTIMNSMTITKPTPDKPSTKKYKPKNTGGPSKNLNLTPQKKYDKNKTDEVSIKKKNPYYIFQPTASPKIKDAKLKMWSPFDQRTAVNQQRLKKEPIKIKVLQDRKNSKEGNLYNNLDGYIGNRTKENIKTFPKRVLKYNFNTEKSEVYDEKKDPGAVIGTINLTKDSKDDLLEKNKSTSITDKLSDVVVNPKYLEKLKDKFFTNKDHVVMIGPSKNHSKSNKRRDITYEMERKIKQKIEERHPEKSALIELWETSRLPLPGLTKKKNFIKFRRTKAMMPSTAAELLKHPDRSPRKISYPKKLSDNTNANGLIKIPMTTTPVEDYNSETMPTQWFEGVYLNPFNHFKTKIHKQFNENNKWSPYKKNRNRTSKYNVKSAVDGADINSVNTKLQEDKNETESNCDDDITSPSNLPASLKTDENRLWILDVYKNKTPPVDPLFCSQKRNYFSLPLTKRKRPVFVVQKPGIKIPKRGTKTKTINRDTLVLEKKPKKYGIKYPSIRDYRNNGDKCPFSSKLSKKTKPEESFLHTKNAERKIVTVKVLNCPKMKEEATNEDKQWAVLPADMEDEWIAYQESKSRSDLTNSYQTKTEETPKPDTMTEPSFIAKHSAEAEFFNVLLSREIGNSVEIDLGQTPNPEPTAVKVITDNYLNERELEASIFRQTKSRLKEENYFDLRKMFSRDKQTPSSDVQSTEPEAEEEITETHQQQDHQPDETAETTEDTIENQNDDATTNNATGASESSQNKSMQVVIPETTDTLVDNQPDQYEECRWTKQMAIPKMNEQPFLKKIPSNFPIANICRTPRPSSNKKVVVLRPKDIQVAIKNVSPEYQLTPSKLSF